MIRTILVIDDDHKFSFGLVSVLRRAGFKVKSVTNGSEGIKAVETDNPDLIICDIMMPPPNGMEVKKQLSLTPDFAKIPFLFLTARTSQVDRLAGLKMGADDYITKPFNVDELLERIMVIFRREELGKNRLPQNRTG